MSETFPHWCADGHPKIGFSTDQERCPVCVAQADTERACNVLSDTEDALTAATQAREKAERERDVLLSRESEVLKISGLVKHTNVNDCSGCGCMGLTGPEAMTMVVERLNQALASHKVFEARIKAMTYAHNSTLQRLAACEKGNAMYHEENARLDAQVAKLNRIIDGDESLASSRKESPAAVAEPLTEGRINVALEWLSSLLPAQLDTQEAHAVYQVLERLRAERAEAVKALGMVIEALQAWDLYDKAPVHNSGQAMDTYKQKQKARELTARALEGT